MYKLMQKRSAMWSLSFVLVGLAVCQLGCSLWLSVHHCVHCNNETVSEMWHPLTLHASY